MTVANKRRRASRIPEARNLVSLFSGAMGLDLGLEQAGFHTRVIVETNLSAVETVKLNRPTLKYFDQPVADVSTELLLEKAGISAGEVTLVSGGPCCQSFSTAGKRGSLADPRGGLFRDFCRVVHEIRPRFFIMENVKGILSAAVKHRPLNQRGPGFPPLMAEEELGSALRVIIEELKSLKYHVIFGLLNAADFGVPQKRWRVFFLGSRDGEELYLPRPTHLRPDLLNGHKRLKRWVTIEDALENVQASQWRNFTSDRVELLRQLAPGQNWRDLPETLHRAALGAALDSWGGRVGFCRRLSWEEPAPTLVTAPDGRATTLCHPEEDRPLAIEEYAALQQFPKHWKFSGSLGQQYIQIGNAVPVGLGFAIGRMLRQVMRKTAQRDTRKRSSQPLTVTCGDTKLQERITRQKKTQLNPPHMRKITDAAAAREWLAASAN